MTSTEKLDTHRKALTLNLDASTFGSFAEIGAGQEVVRWFLLLHPFFRPSLVPCSSLRPLASVPWLLWR